MYPGPINTFTGTQWLSASEPPATPLDWPRYVSIHGELSKDPRRKFITGGTKTHTPLLQASRPLFSARHYATAEPDLKTALKEVIPAKRELLQKVKAQGDDVIGEVKVSNVIGGMRGLVERNTMRYYLAIEAYLGSLATPQAGRAQWRFEHWFDATEQYPRQLHEIDRAPYLEMKRNEYQRQQAAP